MHRLRLMQTVHHRVLATCALVVLAGCGPEAKPPTTQQQAEAPTPSEQHEDDESGAIEPRAENVFTSGPAELVSDAISDLPESTGLETQDGGGWTPLMLAAQHNSAEVVSVLLKAGAKVEAQDETGRTPLMAAATTSELEEVLLALLAAGANAKVENKMGKRALDYAKDNKKLYKTPAYEQLKDATLK